MKKQTPLFLLLAISLLLSSCSSQQKAFVSLPETIQKEINCTNVYIKECQKEMAADIESSNISTYTGGGLLFGLIDGIVMANRHDNAKEAMTDIHKEIQSFNFHENFRVKLAHKLQGTEWMNVSQINFIEDVDEKVIEEFAKNAKSDAIAVSRLYFKLNPDFTVLTGILYFELYPTSCKIKEMVKCEKSLETPIFKFNISATQSLPKKGEDIKENASIWVRENGIHLRQALENILKNIFLQLEGVLKNPNHVE